MAIFLPVPQHLEFEFDPKEDPADPNPCDPKPEGICWVSPINREVHEIFLGNIMKCEFL